MLDNSRPFDEGEACFVVGVGASAGGLAALEELVKNVAFDRMAFVVVQHLSPTHESLLTQLLARVSTVTVVTAENGVKVERNNVYVAPPNVDVAIVNGVLHLLEHVPVPGPRLSVDFFFRSLAEDQGPRAIGVVLSGTGTDGTFGLRAIKEAGGITFVQEPSTAKFDGMPQSALASGNADYRLSPTEIAQELQWIGARPESLIPVPHTPGPEAQQHYARLFVLVRNEFGNDLGQYKPTTVQRRIERRMALQKITRLDEYVRFVQQSPAELRALYSDMLISVTRFFRDREPFDELGKVALPRVVAGRAAGSTLRAWVPACATGEEVYSLAICITEFLEGWNLDLKLQLFGTDVDDDAIEIARRGRYPQNIAQDVSPERLAKFFVEVGDEYQICARLRDTVIFSRHNLYRDPPFSRIDVVSCRNLLIYLQPATQKKVLRVLNHALKLDGYLMLGTSESVGDAADLFSLVDRKNKIYTKKSAAPFAPLDSGFTSRQPEPPVRPGSARAPGELQALAERKLLELYVPAGVVVDDRLQVLHFRGHTGPFLDPVGGTASLDVTRVVRSELRIDVKRAVERTFETGQRTEVDVVIGSDGGSVHVDVVPLSESIGRPSVAVLFQTKPPDPQPVEVEGTTDAQLQRRVSQLERELSVARDSLQTAYDERARAEEEFRFAAEELQSTNEELQSTNEELETSKEELQSTNEELVTVNDELQSRMRELGQSNDDLHNVMLGVDQAVVIASMDLRIRRFTHAAEKLFNLVPADVGRTVDFLERFLGGCQLGEKVSQTIQTLAVTDQQVLASNHRWYRLRVAPYKTVDHAIRGAIITLADIDVRKKATDLDHEIADYVSKHLAAVTSPLLLVDRRLRMVWANDAFVSRFQVAREEILGARFSELGTREWLGAPLRDRLDRTLDSGDLFRDVPVAGLMRDEPHRTQRVGASRVPVSVEQPMALISIDDG
ncbi:MAG: PAS domain-containing protein [Myxococcaceae bacterium]|nr:PAS domain-containing protein [Myxococcaceae bacterium]